MRKRVRSTPRVVLLLTLLCGGPLIPSPTLGQAAGDEYQERLQERDRLWAEAQRLRAQGQLDEATTAAEKMLAIEREALGAGHQEVAASLAWLAGVYAEREDFAAARAACREVLALRVKLHGEKHWQVIDARWALARVERLAALDPDQRRRLAKADRLNQRVVRLYEQCRYREALELAQEALKIDRQLLGEEHPDYAKCLRNLAGLYHAMGAYGRAEPLFRQALEIRKKALGEEHPDYATSLNNLAVLYHDMGAYDRAELRSRQALEVTRKAVGEEHPDYAKCLNNLAGLYHDMGAYGRAEPLYRQALEIWKKAVGEEHPDYAFGLNNLAGLYHDMGAYGRAEPLYRQALEITKKAVGEEHPDYASSLNNLAELYHDMGAYGRAEPLCRQALEIRKKVVGEEHPDYATGLTNLAGLYYGMGAYDQAEPLYRQALEIRKKALGEEHPDYAFGLNNLATLYQATNRPQQALTTLGRGMEVEQLNLRRVFAFSAEPAMHAYLAKVATSLEILLSMTTARTAADPAAAETALTWSLRRKARHPRHPLPLPRRPTPARARSGPGPASLPIPRPAATPQRLDPQPPERGQPGHHPAPDGRLAAPSGRAGSRPEPRPGPARAARGPRRGRCGRPPAAAPGGQRPGRAGAGGPVRLPGHGQSALLEAALLLRLRVDRRRPGPAPPDRPGRGRRHRRGDRPGAAERDRCRE